MPLHIEVGVVESDIGRRSNRPELYGQFVPELTKGKPLVGLSHILRTCLIFAQRTIRVQNNFRNCLFFTRNLLPSCRERGKQRFIGTLFFTRFTLRHQRSERQVVCGRCRSFFMLHLDTHHGKPMRTSDNDVINPLKADFLKSHGLNLI